MKKQKIINEQLAAPVDNPNQPVVVHKNPGEDLGIASLITSILSYSIVAIILGFIGLSKSKKVGQNNNFALAGTIIGFIGILAQLAFITLLIVAIYFNVKDRPPVDIDPNGSDPAVVKTDTDKTSCNETNYPKIKNFTSNNTYRLYIDGEIKGEGYLAYAEYGSNLLVCSSDDKLIKSIPIPEKVSIRPGKIDDASNLDFIVIDSGTDITRLKTLVTLKDDKIITFYAQGDIVHLQGYLIFVYRDLELGMLRPNLHDGYARSIWALNLESKEIKPIIRANKDYDYSIGDLTKDGFAYTGSYYSNESYEIRKTKFTSGTYKFGDLVNEFRK